MIKVPTKMPQSLGHLWLVVQMFFWNRWNQEWAGVAHQQGVFTSIFLGKNPITSQTRRTFNRSRANLNGPIRTTFLFCFYVVAVETNRRLSCSRVPQSSSSLAVTHRRALGSRRHWDLKSISTLPEVKTEFDYNSKLVIIYSQKFRQKCF